MGGGGRVDRVDEVGVDGFDSCFVVFVILFLLCLSFFVLCLFSLSFLFLSFFFLSFLFLSFLFVFVFLPLPPPLPSPFSSSGVGDHPHSWALDGYRCKRWNGSSEDYGMRWNQGDVVGCLLDLDSMQMKFYLNGEDLGNDGGGRWWLQWTVVVPMTDDVYPSFLLALLSFFPSFLLSFFHSFLFHFFFFQGWPTVIFMKVVVVACIPPSVST